MVAEQEINIVQDAAFSDWSCTADAFFCRLEEYFDCSAKFVQVLCNPAAKANSHCQMAVMAAGMHSARILAAPSLQRRVYAEALELQKLQHSRCRI